MGVWAHATMSKREHLYFLSRAAVNNVCINRAVSYQSHPCDKCSLWQQGRVSFPTVSQVKEKDSTTK
eukprot:1648808-Amphidinium_carterae.2